MLLLLAAGGLPALSTCLMIVGAFLFIFSTLYGWVREPWAWDRNLGIGLMVLAIGCKDIFGL